MVQAVGASTQGKILYINKVDSSGWVLIRLKSGEKVPVLEYTKVQLIETKAGRTFFTVLDGGSKGSVASMGEVLARQYLGNKAPLETGGRCGGEIRENGGDRIYCQERYIHATDCKLEH